MPVMCRNGVGCILLTVSQARLACSYFAKVQPCGPDCTYGNWTEVNTCRLLLSSFVPFNGGVKVNSLAFTIGNFRPYLSEFVSQNVAAAVWLKAALSLQQKSNAKKNRKANLVYKKEKTNRKWQDSRKSAASGEESLWLTNDEAKSGKDHERSTLHEHRIKIAQAKTGPRQTDGARLEKLLTQEQIEKMILPNSECPC